MDPVDADDDFAEDEDEHLTGAARTRRVDLGLAISGALLLPGERLTQEDIAAFCGCSRGAIYMIEQAALHKLRKRLACHRDPLLREMIASLLN